MKNNSRTIIKRNETCKLRQLEKMLIIEFSFRNGAIDGDNNLEDNRRDGSHFSSSSEQRANFFHASVKEAVQYIELFVYLLFHNSTNDAFYFFFFFTSLSSAIECEALGERRRERESSPQSWSSGMQLYIPIPVIPDRGWKRTKRVQSDIRARVIVTKAVHST